MNTDKMYKLQVINTCTQCYEEITVTQAVYDMYRRSRWNIEDSDKSFHKHEIQFSSLTGAQDAGFENFKEFIDSANTPEQLVLQSMEMNSLYQAISALSDSDQALIQGLFFDGMTEREYAEKLGIYHNAVHEQKVRIIKKLQKLLKI